MFQQRVLVPRKKTFERLLPRMGQKEHVYANELRGLLYVNKLLKISSLEEIWMFNYAHQTCSTS